jgi:hypothetical protein
MPNEFVKLASLRVRGLGRIGGKVLGQKSFRPIPILQPKWPKMAGFRELILNNCWSAFVVHLAGYRESLASNRSYLTCNPPSGGFVEMCCCDHEARNFVWRPMQK